MSTFTSGSTTATSPVVDPRKRVRYLQGMVLGVDDFVQESTYHAHQNYRLAREAVGYGTLSGLHVTLKDRGKGLEAMVSAGAALDPCGRLICVPRDQCAVIGEWLRVQETTLRGRGWLPGGTFSAHVVLTHRECLTDRQPVPGEPCRCEDYALQESRVLDDFCLELRPDRPPQREEDAIRDLFAWVRLIPLTSNPADGATVDEFADAVRSALEDPNASPVSPPDFFLGSPPSGLALLRDRLPEYWRALALLWVTELRPRWHLSCAAGACGGGCTTEAGATTTSADELAAGVWLAELRLTLAAGTPFILASATVDQSGRPLVLHLRIVQECLLLAGWTM